LAFLIFRASRAIVANKTIEEATPTVIARFELVFIESITADQIVRIPTNAKGIKRENSVAR